MGQKKKCLVCGYSWLSRTTTRPKCCPSCKSRRWDRDPKEQQRVVDDVELIDMVCTKCQKPIPEGAVVYRVQEGVNVGGVFSFTVKEYQGLLCDSCVPPEDVIPFISDVEGEEEEADA